MTRRTFLTKEKLQACMEVGLSLLAEDSRANSEVSRARRTSLSLRLLAGECQKTRKWK